MRHCNGKALMKNIFSKSTTLRKYVENQHTFFIKNQLQLTLKSLLFFFCLASCSKGVEDRSHTVTEVINGNTIALKNGLKVQLIGVENTPDARQYLEENILDKKIRFATDRSNRYEIKSNHHEVYAYI